MGKDPLKDGDIPDITLDANIWDGVNDNQDGNGNQIEEIETALIFVEPQFRKSFDPEELGKLKTSIRDNGFEGCIAVKELSAQNKKDIIDKLKEDDFSSKKALAAKKAEIRRSQYLLIYGENRLRAVRALHQEDASHYPDTIPALIKPAEINDKQIRRLRADENLARNNFNPLEEANTILAMMADEQDSTEQEIISLLNRHSDHKKGKADELPHDVVGKLETVLRRYKKSDDATLTGFLNVYRGLQNLPDDILAAMRDDKNHLPYTKAIELKSIKDDKKRAALLQEALKHKLTIKAIRERKKAIKNEAAEQTDFIPAEAKPVLKALQNKRIWEKVQRNKKTLKAAQKLLRAFEADLNALLED